MILCLYGQPGSGKTTISNYLVELLKLASSGYKFPQLDGDEIRKLFSNNDYSRVGRIENLKRISDIAFYLSQSHGLVIISAVFPYAVARKYLMSLTKDVFWVYLHKREIDYVENNRFTHIVEDFEHTPFPPDLTLNTSEKDVLACLDEIMGALNKVVT